MTAGILIIAHAPLASALRECVAHVFSTRVPPVAAFDVRSDHSFEQNVNDALIALQQLPNPSTLVLTDLFGSTPCSVAQKIVDGARSRLIAGVNLPMLLRAITYREEPMDSMVQLVLAGGTQGVMQVPKAIPPSQGGKKNDPDDNDHQQ